MFINVLACYPASLGRKGGREGDGGEWQARVEAKEGGMEGRGGRE